MADPLSVTSIALQVADLVKQLYDYGKEIKGAQKDILSLAGELSALKSVLSLVDQHQCIDSVSKKDEFNEMLLMTRTLLDDLAGVVVLKSTSVQRAVQSLQWPFNKAAMRSKMSMLERLKTYFLLALTLDHKSTSESTRTEMFDLASVLKDDIAGLRQREEAKENRKLLDALSPVSPEKAHNMACRMWEGTESGSWFWRDELQGWLENTGGNCGGKQVMLLSGRSGSGKTTLISRGVEQAIYHAKGQTNVCVAYFYCSYNDIGSQGVRNVLGSWVAQIAASRPDILDQFGEKDSRPESISAGLLEHTLQEIGREIQLVLFADGINESAEGLSLVETIVRLTGSSPKARCIIAATPHCKAVDNGLGSSHTVVDMHREDVLTDIEVHIRNRVSGHPVLSCMPQEEIVQILVPESEGMFRWVDCQLSFLESQPTPRLAQSALRSLPGNLDDSYALILQRVPIMQRFLVKNALLWLSFCHRPLLLEELCEAVIVEEGGETIDDSWRLRDPEYLLSLCQGLAILDPVTSNVALVHGSIMTFLTGERIRSTAVSYFALDPADSILDIIRKSLSYLSMDVFQSGFLKSHEAQGGLNSVSSALAAFPLLNYASTRWAVHAASNRLTESELNMIEQFFLTHHKPGGGNFCFWLRVILGDYALPAIHDSQPLYYAASYGITPAVRLLLSSGLVSVTDGSNNKWHIDRKGGRYASTALQAACFRGHTEVVKILLTAGADPNATNCRGITCVSWAAQKGYVDIVHTLLEFGASEQDALDYWNPRNIAKRRAVDDISNRRSKVPYDGYSL